ncbi:S58 family peptidase, partial [Mesorhizobium sp. M2C.T.Ca.TU.002.02.1.1]
MSNHDPHRRTPSGKPRLRAFGIALDGTPGTSVMALKRPGVSVGYTTLISGEGPLRVGNGPVRTGPLPTREG